MIKDIIEKESPDVICLTEAYEEILPSYGEVISSHYDYGYPNKNLKRRKVILWSKTGWKEVDNSGNSLLPKGRFVSGITSLRNLRYDRIFSADSGLSHQELDWNAGGFLECKPDK